MDKTFYVNVFDTTSTKWLKIEEFKAMKNKDTGKEYYELVVKTNDTQKSILINTFKPELLKFKDEKGKVVPFISIIKYFKDRSIGLLIS
jgi:hypothetical protein